VALVVQIVLMLVAIMGVVAVLGWIAYAIVTGRDLKQRLTDPAPIEDVVETT
jgi:heme/copper-type cytochrome/quinol oxidase subunit 2